MDTRVRRCSRQEAVIRAVIRFMVPVLMLSAGCATVRKGIIPILPPPLRTTQPAPVRTPITRILPAEPVRQVLRISSVPWGWTPAIGISDRWRTIVIHHSGGNSGNAEIFDRYHRNVNHWEELGYHFVIGNGHGSGDGVVEVGPRWLKQKHGAHCKTPGNEYNNHGIGICLVGDFRRRPPSPAQMASLIQLVRFLTDACGIAPERIVTHRGVTGKTECPGAMFPIRALRRAVRASNAASVMP